MTEEQYVTTDLAKTKIEIDLKAIERNLLSIKKQIGAGKKILLAVKADGYGHGAVEVSSLVEQAGLADILGVSSPQEGIELREAGIKLPILVLGLVVPCKKAINAILEYELTQTIADVHLAQQISKEGKEKNKWVKVHLKVDTGMGRIGCKPENVLEIADNVSHLDNIELEGIFSHFPISDDPDSDFTRTQIRMFKDIIEELQKKNINIPLAHFANSSAILNYPDSVFNMTRPGIMAYGYRPSNNCKQNIKLFPSMSFKSCIVFCKRVIKGTPLSYGLTYKTDNDTNIATIPVGYGDGYSRFLSNKGKVIINNKIYPVVGTVCMDQILVDLGDDEYPIGEEVILFGKNDITVETVADWIATIPYEVTCSISKRVKRVYTSS